ARRPSPSPARRRGRRGRERIRPAVPPLLAAHDVPASAIAGAWHLHPAPVVFVLVATALFVPAFARVRRREPAPVPWTRAALFACGLIVMAGPLVSPLNRAGERYLLSAHML